MIPRKYLPEDKLRQRVCQGSIELRALAAQLEQAYNNKARSAQLAEKRLQEQEENCRKDAEKEEKELERRILEEKERTEQREEAIRKLRYQKELDGQLEELQDQRQRIFDQFLAEKQLIDDVIQKIQRENQENLARKQQKKEDIRAQIELYMEQQRVWRHREQESRTREEGNINKFIQEKQVRDAEIERMERERRACKNEQVIKLSEMIEQQRQEKLEQEEILQELLHIRKEEDERRKEERELEEEFRRKLNLRESNRLASQYRLEKEEKGREEEEKWKLKMMQKFAEDDKIEQMNEQRRRMKREEHRRAVHELLRQRKENRLKELAEEQSAAAGLAAREAGERRVLEEERRRILGEHINQLKGYLPTGVLTQEDLRFLEENSGI